MEDNLKELFYEIQGDMEKLSADNHMVRRKALQRLNKKLLEDSAHTESVLSGVFQQLHKPVLKLFDDKMDTTRELSVQVFMRFCCTVNNAKEYLSLVIPTILQRITSEKSSEETEEIRLLLIESLSKLVDVCSNNIGVYIDEIVQILKASIVDPFADVRKASCACACKLVTACPKEFYMQGESLIPPLLKSLSHQHNKVRAAVLQTIGMTVLATSGKTVDDVFTHIAQRTFDQSSLVRSMVSDIIGQWLLTLRDRYSFFAKLLPLIISGFCDEMPEIQQKSRHYFTEAGNQYEKENEDEFKEKRDYQIVKKFEAHITHERPCLGCRALVQRNFSKILPAIVNDLTDWTVSTRIKCVGLLYELVLHCEDHLTMSMELLSNTLCTAAQDDEQFVVQKISETAQLVGMFVEPSVYCKLILPYIKSLSSNKQVSSALLVMAAYIRGSIEQTIQLQLKDIFVTLVFIDVSSSIELHCQQQLLACLEAILSKNVIKDFLAEGACLFRLLLNAMMLAHNDQVTNKAVELMHTFNEHLKGSGGVYELFSKGLLASLKESCNDWTSHSTDLNTFRSLLTHAGESLAKILDDALPLLLSCWQVEKDAEMKLRIFTLMSQLAINTKSNETLKQSFAKHADVFITDSILPNLVWNAGRTAASIRSVAMSFLWALLEGGIVTPNTLLKHHQHLQVQLKSSLEDHNETTRLVTTKVLLKLLKVCKRTLQVEELHALYPVILKRMDDLQDDVRITTTKVMAAYFSCIPASYDIDFYAPHLEHIYKTLLIHLDDPKQNIQEHVLSCLKEGAHIHPALLKHLVEQVKLKHRTQKNCDELIEYCQNV